jgi:serine/threonine protein kinase
MSRIDHIEALFHEARSLPDGTDRVAWAERHCDDDQAMLEEIVSLLKAHGEMQRTVQLQPAPEPVLPTGLFGVYRAVELLGRGGTSAVYRAQRADGQFDHVVALKVMAGYLAGPEFLKKFDTERRLLATLSHNNVTRLLDGGVSASGDPYLITEFVDGQPLDRYCDEHKLDIPARLHIFRQICDAVDYAHRNLIVHRDLKPANILVNTDGVVKLLDFGTASMLAKHADITVTRMRMLTPRYASPEQLRGEIVNISTDVFSLGVVLYELLSGAWPFGDPNSVLSELNRAAGQMAPAYPATVITPAAAECRSTSREQLTRVLKGDLAAIVLKALEAEPAQRYESVRQFAADIDSYLAGRPVSARPQTALYRAGKFLRRRWFAVAAAAIFVFGLLGATLYASQQARIARGRYADLRSLTTMLLFELKDAINDIPGSTQAQKILATRVVKSLDQMEHQSAADPKLRLDLAEAYRQLGELQGSPYGQNLGDSAGALANVGKARALAQEQLKSDSKNQAALYTAAISARTAGEIHFGGGQTQAAIADMNDSTSTIEQLLQLSHTIPNLLEAAIDHQVFGDIYGQPGTSSLGDPALAAAQYRRTIELDEASLRLDPHFTRAQRGIALLRLKLGDLTRFGDPENALAEYRQALTALDSLPVEEKNKPGTRRLRVLFLRKVGGALTDLQQYDEAEPFLKQSLAMLEEFLAADPDDSRARYDVVNGTESAYRLYSSKKDWVRALPLAERLVSVMNDLLAKEPGNIVWKASRGNYQYALATALAETGDRSRAASIGAEGLRELGAVADSPQATPQTFEMGAEAFAEIEPKSLRDPQRALKYAEAFARLRPANDPEALYHVAMALSVIGGTPAVAAAHRALATLAPPRNGRISYVRTELEAIR